MTTIIFGDSIALGLGDEENGGWANLLRKQEMKKGHIAYNLAIDGDTTTGLLNRIFKETMARDKNHDLRIIIAIGINDSARLMALDGTPVTNPSQFRGNLVNLGATAMALAKEVYFIGITPVIQRETHPVKWDKNLFYANDDIRRYNEIISDATGHKINWNAILAPHKFDESCYYDGLHLNTKGHAKLFRIIKKHML